MRWTTSGLVVVSLLAVALHGADAPPVSSSKTATVRVADGFDCPVGRDGTKRYYVARGYRPNGHLGEDWNGEGGGDTDLGDPVCCTAHGIVVFAQDYRMGWGNVIIVRHAYVENGKINYVDSLYGHLNEILVPVGQKVSRGQKIGTIGNNHGQYDAHLHFEMRKNIAIGMFRNSYPRDLTNYWVPSQFLAAHQALAGGKIAVVPVDTFPAQPPPVVAGPKEYTPMVTFGQAKTYSTPANGLSTSPTSAGSALRPGTPIRRPQSFKIDRYGDMRGLEGQ